MVDGDKPCMGFVYESIDRCKETIATAFNNVETDYKEIWDLIDQRWKMMHSPLHAATCYLDPRLFGLPRHRDEEIMNGVIQSIEKLNPNPEIAGLIKSQLRHTEAPELQNFAIRILSQGSRASACERNWSSFDHIHSMKRNRLLSGILEDLVYVRSNLPLALKNVAKESSNSSTPWIDLVPNASMDEVDLYIDSDIDKELTNESNAEASNGFTAPTTLDDIELFDITSGPQEHQE
eukprot:PITA_13199